jgi:serine protease Do
MVRRLMPSVVNIRVAAAAAPDAGTAADAPPQLRVMVGSGFVVDRSGLIMTNDHVIHGASSIAVTFFDGESVSAHVVEAVPMLDLALLKAEGDAARTPIQWGDSATVAPGDEVYAFGNPLGLGLSVSAGIVSAINRDINSTPYDHFIQTDAVINHGNSGGPMFNLRGEVIGVDTSIISPTEGYAGLGFAIPAETGQFVIEQVRKYGWLRPGWIGVQTSTVTPDMATALGMARPQGAMIGVVAPGSPAAKADLRVGDVIMRFGDFTPPDARALHRFVLTAQPGETVPVVIRRGGQESTIPVAVVEWPRADYMQRYSEPAEQPRPPIRPDLGLTLSAATDAVRARHELSAAQTGVVIMGVMAGTDAWFRGVLAGDVIERVENQTVASADDVQRQVDIARSQNKQFALFLMRQKGLAALGPRWLALRISDGDAGTVASNGK